MADRVTQLQDLVSEQADNMWAGISFTEKFSTPYTFTDIVRKTPKLSKRERLQLRLAGEKNEKVVPEKQEQEKTETPAFDYPDYFAKKITRLALDINLLIDSLPDDSMLSPDLQVNSLKKLEEENQEKANELDELVSKGETLLEQVRTSLESLSLDYLKTFFPK